MLNPEAQPSDWRDLTAAEVHTIALQEHETRELFNRLARAFYDRPELVETTFQIRNKFEAYSQAWLMGRTAVRGPEPERIAGAGAKLVPVFVPCVTGLGIRNASWRTWLACRNLGFLVQRMAK
jgi:hypothetical protein